MSTLGWSLWEKYRFFEKPFGFNLINYLKINFPHWKLWVALFTYYLYYTYSPVSSKCSIQSEGLSDVYFKCMCLDLSN